MASTRTTTAAAPKKKRTAKPNAAKQATAPDAKQPPQEPPAPETPKLRALDAAARVLAEADEPLSTRQMIEAMAARGYWRSPNGQTPAATLYAAILREMAKKQEAARFVKTGPGRFTVRKPADQ